MNSPIAPTDAVPIERRRPYGNERETLFDRELSWVEFNRRVLEQALHSGTPLLERVRFLSIVSSNLDEFFMVRIAGRTRGAPPAAGADDPLQRIANAVRALVDAQYQALSTVLGELRSSGVAILAASELDAEQQQAAEQDFRLQLFPALSPQRLTADTVDGLANLRLHVVFVLEPERPGSQALAESGAGAASPAGDNEQRLAIVAVPPQLQRLRRLPAANGEHAFAPIEEVIGTHAAELFPGYRVVDRAVLRVTRDADLEVDEAADEDFVDAMREVLIGRKLSRIVRLELAAATPELSAALQRLLDVPPRAMFGTLLLDLTGLRQLTDLPARDDLRFAAWRPRPVPALAAGDDPWAAIRKSDVLLHHPYESFEHIASLLQMAAADPGVLAIKMTLYRTSGESPVVRALEVAAAAGKQVTVLVELKARFDEQRNIDWASRLERAGAIVVYGIAGLKVHAKALLIVRREGAGVAKYTHLATGNYNDTTARLYTDLALLTAREEIGREATLFFNAITGYSSAPSMRRLIMAPTTLKRTLLAHIEREAALGDRGLIMAKLNSLSDEQVIEALYAASRAGVRIRLNVRGVCLLRPAIEGLSETIRVVSIVDRFLEHSRIVYFGNDGADEVYLASADWMPRNLERRVELMFPVQAAALKRRLIDLLELCFADNSSSYELQANGRYVALTPDSPPGVVRLQQALCAAADADGRRAERRGREFVVRRRPPAA